jgi:hypothetical protein
MKPYFIDGKVMFKRMAVVLVAGLFVGAAAAAIFTAMLTEMMEELK